MIKFNFKNTLVAAMMALPLTQVYAATLTPKTLDVLKANVRPIKVVFLGDSLTAGCGASNSASGDNSFPAVFASLLSAEIATYGSSFQVYRQDIRADDPYAVSNSPAPDVTTANICPAWAGTTSTPFPKHQVIRQGYGGRTSSDVLTFLSGSSVNNATVNNADLVVLELGTNDSNLSKNISPAQYAQNMNNILAVLSNKGVKEVLLLNSLSNGKWENPAITSFYKNTFADLQDYNDALWGAFKAKAGAANQYSIGAMSVGFLDMNSKIVTALGMGSSSPLIPGDTNAHRNLYRWASTAYATDATKTVFGGALDILHPNPIGYRAIAEQIFYNTLSRLPDAPSPTIAAAGVSSNYNPPAIWVQGANFSNATRAYLKSSTGKPWSAQLPTTVANNGTLLSFSLPDYIAPDNCNVLSNCGIQVQLFDLKTGLSSHASYTLSIPASAKSMDTTINGGYGINAYKECIETMHAYWLYPKNVFAGQWGVVTNVTGEAARSASPLTMGTDGKLAQWESGLTSPLTPGGYFYLQVYDTINSIYGPKVQFLAPPFDKTNCKK